jgi:prepilin-type N-terminal cleavage/methylation domain-containing protein
MNSGFKCSRAFSLIEMTAALVLLSIGLFILVQPLSRHSASGVLDQARHTIKQFIRMVEQKAVSDNTTYRIIWNKAAGRYDAYYYNGSQFVADDGDTLASGIAIQSTTFANDQVDFDNLGSPSGGGTLTLRDIAGTTKTVAIVAGSGIVKLP